jgi:hypothetical protein
MEAPSVTIDSLNICHARRAVRPRSAQWTLERRLEQQSEQVFESCAQHAIRGPVLRSYSYM